MACSDDGEGLRGDDDDDTICGDDDTVHGRLGEMEWAWNGGSGMDVWVTVRIPI